MNDTAKLIGKYAIILSVFYLIQILVDHYFSFKLMDSDLEYSRIKTYMYTRIAPPILFNIITALIIYADQKRYNIQGKYAVLLTLLFRSMGVVLFLIYAINSTRLQADKK